VDYFEPALSDIDPLLFKLANYDISKITIIENLFVDQCYDWYYLIKVKELNEMKLKIAEMEKIKV
jgi:hypothetical protein